MAGVVVAALIIPKNLGYAGIAGIPLENGLYAAAAGAILYAVFGTCRQISMGPSSGLAAVAGAAVVTAGVSGGDVATFVAGLTLTSGLLFLVLAVFRMGWLSQFLSRAVVTGFLFGAAIDVVIGELPKLTGTDAEGANSLRELGSWLRTLGEAHAATVVVGVVALVVVFALRLVAPRVPGRWCFSSAASSRPPLFDLEERGVALVGDVPRGLPSVDVPDLGLLLDNAGTVLLAAFALVMIGFSQTAGDARAFAAKHRYQVDIDQESVAQAAANIGAGLLRGMPVSTSLSASSLNDRSGARTGLASLTSGGTVLLALLVLAPLFSALPKPVLAALIIEAVVMGMMDVAEMRRMRRVSRVDFWVAVAALLGTLVFGILAGVVIGIALSLVWLVYVATHPEMPTLGRERGTQVFRDLREHPDDETVPGVVVVRMDGGIFFATADALAGPGPDRDAPAGRHGDGAALRRRQLRRLPGHRRGGRDRPPRGGVGCRAETGECPAGGTGDARTRRRDRPARSRPGPRQRPPRSGRTPLRARSAEDPPDEVPPGSQDGDHPSPEGERDDDERP